MREFIVITAQEVPNSTQPKSTVSIPLPVNNSLVTSLQIVHLWLLRVPSAQMATTGSPGPGGAVRIATHMPDILVANQHPESLNNAGATNSQCSPLPFKMTS